MTVQIKHTCEASPLRRELTLAQLSRWLLRALLFLYVGISLIDPLDQMFHSKSALFLVVMTIWCFRISFNYTKPGHLKVWAGVIAFALVLPITATTIGLFGGRVPLEGLRFSTIEMLLMLFLLLVISSEEIDLVPILNQECIVVALITIAIAIIAIASPLLYEGVFAFTASKQLAYLSVDTDRIGVGIGSFYYKTCATMILPLAYFADRFYTVKVHRVRSLIFALVYFAALVFSGARANALAAAAVVGVFSIKKVRNSLGLGTAAVSVLALTVVAGFVFAKSLDPTEQSNSIKLKHWSSYIAEFEQHPLDLLWGEGAETEFYSAGFEQKTAITELTYMELVRNYGIPVALLILVILSWPLVTLFNQRVCPSSASYVGVAYGAYLLMSASNPLLFNTTGMLLVISVWGTVLAITDERYHQAIR